MAELLAVTPSLVSTVTVAEVVVGAGAKPFIAYSILAPTDYGVGDEVIYPNPGFPIYESQIKAHGAVPVPLHLRRTLPSR